MTSGGPQDGRTAEAGRTLAWFHCFAGIAGDMALGSLLDAGADVTEVKGLLERVPIGGWGLEVEPVLRGGIAASRAIVTVNDNVVVRTYAHIVGLVEEARLPPRVTGRALASFDALARAEARLHRRPVEQVHFHEVGGHDAVIDVVGTAAALEVLGVDEVRASPVATGTGMVRSRHGLLPNPAPAVVALLEGVPLWGRNLAVELTTPTGAALLAALSAGYGPLPPMRITGQGFGAGTRELAELPNCTQVVVGVASPRRADGPVGDRLHRVAAPLEEPGSHPGGLLDGDADADAGQPVALLETNVDDATGEQLAFAVAALLDGGALDAWLTPVVMKKGRPGSVVTVLADWSKVAELRRLLQRTTGSLGVRVTSVERWAAARTLETVWVDGHPIRIKVSGNAVKAEYEDVASVARRTGSSLRDLARRAEAQWLASHPDHPDPIGGSTDSGGLSSTIPIDAGTGRHGGRHRQWDWPVPADRGEPAADGPGRAPAETPTDLGDPEPA